MSGAVATGAASSSAPGGLAAGQDRVEGAAAPYPTPSPTQSVPSTTPTPYKPSTPRPFKPTPAPTADPNRLYHVPILMYHRILPEVGDNLPDLVVSPAMFDAQLKGLFDAGWHSITMATLAEQMETDRTIPAKTFVITFDDGWADGYDYAFPIMRKYGFVGTFYMISSRIDQPNELSTLQMRTLEAAGNDIGNHTEFHISLTTVSGDRVVQEVEDASQQIARAVGHRPVSLAYPMGAISVGVVLLLEQIPDMKIAVHTGFGTYETWFARYDMPRVRVHPGTDAAQILSWFSL
jgi:peptidoglycan/xylan/chitin deacetylase (PgdA/CDA1 family)